MDFAPANTTRGEEVQSDHAGAEYGTRYCGCAPAPGCQGHGQVASAHLDDILHCSQALNLVRTEANDDLSIMYTYGSRGCPFSANRCFHRLGYLNINRIRQAMCNDRRFKGYNRAIFL